LNDLIFNKISFVSEKSVVSFVSEKSVEINKCEFSYLFKNHFESNLLWY